MGLCVGAGLLFTFAAAELQEGLTNENFFRDSFIFQGNQEAYDIAMLVTEVVVSVGTIVGQVGLAKGWVPQCFVAGTAVLTVAGAVVIEDIEVGDLVWAYDDQTGDVALKEVVQTFKNETYELTTVRTDDGQEIVATPGHKFYTLDRDWISAVELKAGDRLLNVNGDVVIVEWIQHEIFENPIEIYNFEVRDYHTYYVAQDTNAPVQEFVLVHNRDCSKLSPDQQALAEIIKENGKSKPLSMKDAETLVDWSKEYGMNVRIDMGHPTRNAGSRVPHLHTGFNNWHIPII